MKEYKYKINGNPYNVVINDADDTIVTVEVNGTPYKVEIDKPKTAPASKVNRPARPAVSVSAPKPAASKSGIKSPLPGVILSVKVKVGDTVKKGQCVLVLEAMKMENNIPANKDGKVVDIKVNQGESVLEGADLIIIE